MYRVHPITDTHPMIGTYCDTRHFWLTVSPLQVRSACNRYTALRSIVTWEGKGTLQEHSALKPTCAVCEANRRSNGYPSLLR